MGLQTKISDVSDQWSIPTDIQYVNRQIAYAWHPARPTCGRRSTKCWVPSSTPTNHPQVRDFSCRIHNPALADRPSFTLCVYLSRASRRCLFQYMYNPPRTILDMRLQGTAHSSEEIELQGVTIWFLINSRVRVLMWESWSFLRWWLQKILCGTDTCCCLCCWLSWMCVTGKSRSVRLSISLLGRSFGRWSCWMKAGYWLGGRRQVQWWHDVQQHRQTHQEFGGKKTPWQNSCLCRVPDHTPMANHIHTHTHTHTTNTYMFAS